MTLTSWETAFCSVFIGWSAPEKQLFNLVKWKIMIITSNQDGLVCIYKEKLRSCNYRARARRCFSAEIASSRNGGFKRRFNTRTVEGLICFQVHSNVLQICLVQLKSAKHHVYRPLKCDVIPLEGANSLGSLFKKLHCNCHRKILDRLI